MEINNLFLEKLNNLKKEKIFEKEKSIANILLFKHYLQTMYKWYDRLSLEWDYKITKRKEGHNLIEIINPILSNELIDMEYFRSNLLNDTSFNTSKYREFDYLFVYLSVYWNILEDTYFSQYKDLPKPYEAPLKILLRGGHIFYNDTYYNVSGIDIRKSDKTLNFILPSLENDFLDYIDSRCRLIGSDGIPNQERVNELWEEFQSLKK